MDDIFNRQKKVFLLLSKLEISQFQIFQSCYYNLLTIFTAIFFFCSQKIPTMVLRQPHNLHRYQRKTAPPSTALGTPQCSLFSCPDQEHYHVNSWSLPDILEDEKKEERLMFVMIKQEMKMASFLKT